MESTSEKSACFRRSALIASRNIRFSMTRNNFVKFSSERVFFPVSMDADNRTPLSRAHKDLTLRRMLGQSSECQKHVKKMSSPRGRSTSGLAMPRSPAT